jgi:hypothetical protein
VDVAHKNVLRDVHKGMRKSVDTVANILWRVWMSGWGSGLYMLDKSNWPIDIPFNSNLELVGSD